MDSNPLTGPEELYRLVSNIPYGKVCSYGLLGRSLRNPVSGLVTGNWMSRCDPETPWWRVVAADGRLVIAKKSPYSADLQRRLLEEEGVAFEGDKVRIAEFWWAP